MANRVGVVALVWALVLASAVFVAIDVARPASAAPPAVSVSTTPTVVPDVVTPGESINYTYSNFFNVPYGEWWDMRTNAGYGDEPIGASCFNQTSVNDGTCTTNVAGISRVAQYPYENWAGPGTAAAIYAPYRVNVKASGVGGYNLSQPVFLPVLNYAAVPGNSLSFNWNMQYLDKANLTSVTSTLGCYANSGGTADDGYQLVTKLYLTLDNEEAARLFGATVSSTTGTIQNWWNTNTLTGCSMSNKQAGSLETSVNSWFQNQANGKWDIYNGYDGSYISLYTNITATVVSGGASGLTHVYIEHGAWGTETLLDRMFYWGNATYAGSQLDSSKAKGWWGMENGWWEGVHYAGVLTSAAMAFNLTGVLQYHFQERSAPGPDGVFRSSTNLADSDDIPYWTWGPQLLDYVPSAGSHVNSELDRYSGLNYIKTTPGSSDYGTNTSFDYTPISWSAKTGESWYFIFPKGSAAYFQNPDTATLGTSLPTAQLPSITSAFSLMKIFPPPGYGTWNAAANTWSVNGPSSVSWPAGTPGNYPYLPYPGIYLQPGNIPPTVTTNPATAITTTSATLNGATSALGTSTSVPVGFYWGTSPSLSGAANVTAATQTVAGAFSTGLTGLTPGTTYFFQAWANGAAFVKGSILSFTAAVTPPSVTTSAASAIGTTTATLNGATSSLGTATSVSVGFLWGTSPTLVGATNVTVGTQTAPASFSSGLASLVPGTAYYFEAWANGQGFAHGTILTFTTAVIPPSVTTSAATAITTSGATLNGNLGSLGTAASVTVGFLYGTSPILSGATNASLGTHALGAFSDAVSGLSPGTTYYFEAWANGQGFAVGGILNFKTGTTPPSVATNAASSITTTTATLNGATSSLGTATSVPVGFYWGTSATLSGATNVTVTTQTVAGAFSTGIASLAPGTTYYFQAWASGNGFATGSIVSFLTAVTPPSVATNAATGITTAAATLNGATSSLGTATSVGVGFYYGTSATLLGATNTSVTTQTVAGAFSLALNGLTPGTTYYFQAWANGNGFAKGSILNFKTSTTPPSVTTNAATGITTTAAILNGATSTLGTATSVSVGFLWSTSSGLSGATNVSAGSQTVAGAFSSALSSLAPGTTYYFAAWANGNGFAQGATLSFTTGVTPPTVVTDAATGVSTSGATLNGHTTSLGTATSVAVGFLYGISPALSGATNVSAGSQTVAGAFSSVLTGLTPGTTYYFEAWANGQGFAKGLILSFTVGTLPPSVATNAASGIGSTAATLNGATSSLGTAASVSVGFYWGTSATLSGATNVTVTTQTVVGAFSLPLAGLTPGVTYYFAAWANGNGFAQGSTLSFTTGVSAPGVQTNAATSIATTSATLNGATSSLGTATSVSVGFLWGTSASLSGATNVTVTTQNAPGAFNLGITSLTPGVTYYFEAWANGQGFAIGAILHFTTAVTPPSVATNAASGIGTTTATLNGATSSLGTATSVTVGFLWGTSASLIGATNVTVTTQTTAGSFAFSLTGLTPGQTYYFRAWANGQGFAVGAILSFTTSVTPPSVSTTAATAIGTTGATLNGNLGSLGTAASVTVGFLYGTSASLVGATNASVGVHAVGSFSDAVTGLSPGTTYYFEAWADGQGFAVGGILSFTTSVTPPSVATNAATGIATTAATLNGATSSLGTATSVSVGFLWGTSPTLLSPTNVTVGSQTAAAVFSLALSGLTPGVTYYFQAWALGDGFAAGAILHFTAGVSPPVVQTNPASGVTTTGATLNGATTSLGTATSVTVGFLWGTSPTLLGATNVTVTTQSAAAAFLDSLSSLTPGTTYYFQAWALGSGFAMGAILSVTTAVTPPSVTTDAASGIGTTTATLNGATTSLGTASSVTVGFLYGTSPSLLGATNATVFTQNSAASFNFGLTGLTPGTTYYFQAWALGDGFAVGTILSFTTSVTPPSVTTSAATAIGTSGATLNGNLASLGTATSVLVGFLYGTSPTLFGATNVSLGAHALGAFSDGVSGLAPGTTYFFEAWALGDGFATGTILSFTTGVTPPSVATNAASGITTTAATLNGATSSLGTATSVSVGFLWGTSPTLSGATNASVTTQTAPAAFSLGLTGLTPGLTYYFQAWALGNGFAAGSILSFTAGVSPPVVQTNPASGVTTTAATLNGATTSLGTAGSVSVGFLWGTSPILASATNVSVTTQTAVGAFAFSLSSLTPGVTYYFQAWASGDGFAMGAILSVTTAVTPPSVTTNAASGVTTSAATLNGNLASLGTAGSVSVGFYWGTSATLLGATNDSVGSLGVPGAFVDSLSGLSPGTTYYFQAWANGQGFALGAILSFTTGTTPPSVATNAASGVGTTTATLNGATSSLGTATSVSVGFYWGTDPLLAGAASVSAGSQTTAGAFSFGLTGLTPGVTYYFAAWANGNGLVQGDILSFTTLLVPPTVQTNAASGIGTTGATLNGASSSFGSAPSLLVGFYWGTSATLAGATNATAAVLTTPGSFSLVLSGLAPDTTYYFQAWANGSAFVTGSILSFTTAPLTYPVTFTESGLPSGTLWSVTLGGSTQSSTTTQIVFQEPNGTYAYTVGAVSGYGATPSSGTVTVAGTPVSVSITFTPTAPVLCADLYNRSAWVSSRHLKLSKVIIETFYARVVNCGNAPVSVYVLFNVYTDHKPPNTLVVTLATPVYVSLLPGQIVTLSVDWTNPTAGVYTATAQAFYGAVGTTPTTPGATVKTFQFKVDPPGGKPGALLQGVSTADVVGGTLVWLPLRFLRGSQIR